ncbi:MAG: glycosyltransferase family 4 protein [Elusimicrobiales bacterium]|nr:glycosyltransferase family 4 protein [Elusimicrobiales bacterium]
MKILFITPDIPHLYGGGAGRMYYEIKYLHINNISVDLMTYDIENKYNSDVFGFLNKYYLVKVNHNFSNKLSRIIKPYPYYKNFENQLLEIIKLNDYDLIHVHKFQMASYLSNIKNIPIIIDLWACGLEGVWNEFVYESNFLIKFRKFLRIPKYYFSDIIDYNKFSNFFVVSDKAKNYILNKYKNKNVYIVPNGLEYISENNKKNEKESFNLIFTGDMGFYPNIDAVIYFYSNIYTHIKKEIKDLRFYIVGRNPVKEIVDLSKNDSSVIVTGMVDDIKKYLLIGDIFVAPLRCGLGIRNKILEAMGSGVCVVGFPNAFEGIDVINGENAILCDSNKIFIDKIIFLYKNKQIALNIGSNAKRVIKEKYMWNNIVNNMVKNYYEILNNYNNKR